MKHKPTIYKPTADLGKALLIHHLTDDLGKFYPIVDALGLDLPLNIETTLRAIPGIPITIKVLALKAAFPELNPGAIAAILQTERGKVYAQTKKQVSGNADPSHDDTRTRPTSDEPALG